MLAGNGRWRRARIGRVPPPPERTPLLRHDLMDALAREIEVLTQPCLVPDGQRLTFEHVSNDSPELLRSHGVSLRQRMPLYSAASAEGCALSRFDATAAR